MYEEFMMNNSIFNSLGKIVESKILKGALLGNQTGTFDTP